MTLLSVACSLSLASSLSWLCWHGSPAAWTTTAAGISSAKFEQNAVHHEPQTGENTSRLPAARGLQHGWFLSFRKLPCCASSPHFLRLLSSRGAYTPRSPLRKSARRTSC